MLIVDLPGQLYILVVMSNFPLGDEVGDIMTEISQAVYDYFQWISGSRLYGTYGLVQLPSPVAPEPSSGYYVPFDFQCEEDCMWCRSFQACYPGGTE